MTTNRARSILGRGLGSALIGWFLGAAGAQAYAADKAPAAECTSCHDQGQKLDKSAHKGLTCETCHDSHEKYPHPANIPKPQCATCHADQAGDYESGVHGQARKHGNEGAPDCALCHGSAHELLPPKSQAFRMAVPDTCGMCHSDVVEQYRGSVHGQALAQGITQAPLCTDCHGEHKIIKPTNAASPVNAAHIRETCGSCHGDVRLTRKFGLPSDRLVSFDSSYHGLAAKAGSQTVANCASCHGVHNILPSSDPEIHHQSQEPAEDLRPVPSRRRDPLRHQPGARAAEGGSEPAALRWVRQFYLLLIPVTIGLMLLHHGGDWIRKLIRARFRRGVAARSAPSGRGPGELRMLPFERVQHAAAGALVYDAGVDRLRSQVPGPVVGAAAAAGGGHDMRSLIHRVAALVFIAVSLTHLVSLIVSRKLRDHWKEMIPKVRDAREASSNFAYNLGLGDVPPPRSSHSYIEKAEYWAVIWGAVIMTASGLMLWANSLALRLLPKALAGSGDVDSFLRSRTGRAGDRGVALLFHHFRSRRLSSQHCVSDRLYWEEGRFPARGRSACTEARAGSSRRLITNHDAQPAEPPAGGWLSPLIHLSSNWISRPGVILVTTATVFWLFLLPTTLRGEMASPYMGILAFLVLPGPFFAGLVLIPLGMWFKRKRERHEGIYPPDFPGPSGVTRNCAGWSTSSSSPPAPTSPSPANSAMAPSITWTRSPSAGKPATP